MGVGIVFFTHGTLLHDRRTLAVPPRSWYLLFCYSEDLEGSEA
jgi:hypothetical protein